MLDWKLGSEMFFRNILRNKNLESVAVAGLLISLSPAVVEKTFNRAKKSPDPPTLSNIIELSSIQF